ncbi:unnamed protein product [Psylliodes chrysocephalus]|uniref:CHK kinase-like domain-containing protein n=1 Tax=Psylliodes chrysocephalus TaxID=3402493 RepID=A0A9P0G7F9_9CUCU|nr:unnamed protein product [Psylliodes chrysocephala]
MEINKIKVVLEVILKDLNKINCANHRNFNNLSDLHNHVNGNGIDVEKLKCGVKKLISDFEEENIKEDSTKNLIFDCLLIIYSNTTHSQRFCEIHNILEHFYNKLVQRWLELEQTASIITFKKFNQVVRKLIPFVKLSIVSEQLTSKVDIKQALQELNEVILYPNISREDCYEIIRNKFGTTNVDFVDFKVEPVNERFGVMADYYRLKINIKENGKLNTQHFFVKSLYSQKDEMRTTFTRNVYIKEQMFYTEFIPLLRKFALDEVLDFLPICYFSNDNFMIYDDISVEGYSNIDVHTTLSYEQLSSIFKLMSKLHSTSILFEEKLSEICGKPVYLNDYFKKMVADHFFTKEGGFGEFFDCSLRTCHHIFNKIPEFFKNKNIDKFKQQLSTIFEDCYEKVKPSKVSRNFLCHGDAWINNILFKKNSLDCLLLDYQVLRYSSPALDILFILYLHTDKKTRNNLGTKLLYEYYTNLKQNVEKYGVNIDKIYSYETYQKSLEEFKPMAMIMALSYMQLTLLPKEKTKYIFEDAVLGEKFLTEDRTDLMDKFWDEMDVTKLKDVFEELYISLNKK